MMTNNIGKELYSLGLSGLEVSSRTLLRLYVRKKTLNHFKLKWFFEVQTDPNQPRGF